LSHFLISQEKLSFCNPEPRKPGNCNASAFTAEVTARQGVDETGGQKYSNSISRLQRKAAKPQRGKPRRMARYVL
jgi:hypothetical protein